VVKILRSVLEQLFQSTNIFIDLRLPITDALNNVKRCPTLTGELKFC
jgi:hypothetical protein